MSYKEILDNLPIVRPFEEGIQESVFSRIFGHPILDQYGRALKPSNQGKKITFRRFTDLR